MDSLRWRRGDLQGKMADVSEKLQALSKEEDALRQELRAVEQLLFAADGDGSDVKSAGRPEKVQKAPPGPPGTAEPTPDSLDLTGYGPTARKILASVEQVIREAGVPLHYRVLAEEVQKRAPLSGKDPGATLIAHLHRAQDHFPRVGRGVYGIQGMVDAQPTAEPSNGSNSTKRRRRTRRRRTQ
jgi:hypothetical protein